MNAPPRRQYLFYGDPLRIFACFLVVLIHSLSGVFAAYSYVPDTTWQVVNFLKSNAFVCVPLFVMLSGAIFLDPSYKMEHNFLWKRGRRLIEPLVLWNVIFLWWNIWYYKYSPNLSPELIKALALNFFTTGWYYHLYFIYLLFAMHLSTPLLRKVPIKLQWILITISAAVSTLFWINALSNNKPIDMYPLRASELVAFFGFYLLGGMLRNIQLRQRATWAIVAGLVVLSIVNVTAVNMRATALNLDKDRTSYITLLTSPLLLVMSVGVFAVFAQINWRKWVGNKGMKAVHYLSSLSLPIFFLHPIVLEYLRDKILPRVGQNPYTLIGSLSLAISTFLGCIVILSAFRCFKASMRKGVRLLHPVSRRTLGRAF